MRDNNCMLLVVKRSIYETIAEVCEVCKSKKTQRVEITYNRVCRITVMP